MWTNFQIFWMKDLFGKDMVSKKNKNKVKFQTFQDTILNLQKFWSKHGCVILQPYDMEVGAGTFHPATTLRSLGPKPWKAAYVQPSEDLQMVDMEIIQIDYNIIINFKLL